MFLCNSPSLVCFSIGFLLFGVAVSQISLGSKLSVVENDFWVSSNGDFACGFFNNLNQPNQYQIGIRFNPKSIPDGEQTVVWVAGANVRGVTVWTSKTSHLSVASAALGDNGNLVLMNSSKDVVWQSFDTPADTLLPGQILSASQTLRPLSKSSVSSYYDLQLNVQGRLQLRFLRLDADGNLRLYSWAKALRSWKSVWQAVENQCNVFATCYLSGVCLFNASGSHVCKCPFTSTAESSSECLVPSQLGCDSGSTLVTYDHTFLYGIYPPNDSVSTISLEQCKTLCLNDPSCTAVSFTNDGIAQCHTRKTRFITGYSDPAVGSISFVKMCLDPVAAFPNLSISSPPQSQLKRSYAFSGQCLIRALSGTLVTFVTIQLGIGFCFYKRRNFYRKQAALALRDPNSQVLLMLSYNEIMDLTGNFGHHLGPMVFKGMLPNDQPVAVKGLKTSIEERKFRASVSRIGGIHQKNLAKLEGYCCESDHRFLVYEFVENGSVDHCIQDPKLSRRLTWRKRIDICLSVARAISYLHAECREFVSHGNLKCENVLLDENLDAKVTEFGLGRLHSDTLDESAENDVEGFGKMMVILVTGQTEADHVCEWAYKEWISGHAEGIVDERIEGGVDSEEVERLLRLAFWCLQVDKRLRPSMGEVVKVFEGTLTVDRPPPPFLCWMPLEEEEDYDEEKDN
ncbi:G-type lectin S-receptor-like serine/threonine-protein kinase SD3-1 [Vitis vinifera]|uniref:G-type lectin S-receptor-like serine/threonine-protein kinase SD3-1 n=1 Tax=Vitis vinifera TaxID=29760 RepID=A0A438JLB1_VITVI|nr:G-type lectin S-receptor-like serine/threonine-protein kinase SD3-1 [Vitis vinifera]